MGHKVVVTDKNHREYPLVLDGCTSCCPNGGQTVDGFVADRRGTLLSPAVQVVHELVAADKNHREEYPLVPASQIICYYGGGQTTGDFVTDNDTHV